MTSPEGLVHRKLPPDAAIHTRQPVPSHTKDTEQTPTDYLLKGLSELREQLGNLARAAENRVNLVDEYNSAPITGGGSSTQVRVLPTYEYMPEKIESVIIVGPTGNVTLQLGDRVWPLTIPAAGFLTFGAVGILLSRTDDRILTAQTPGTYFLELMGVADRRYNS